MTLPWSAPACRRDQIGQRARESWRSDHSSADPRFRICVQRGELWNLEEILYFSKASEILTGPASKRVEGHHVGPALPWKARQSLAAQPPFPIAAIDQHEIDIVRVAIA